jgi:cysteine desulfurase
MVPYLTEEFGNANSLHGWGSKAREAVEKARAQVAALVGAEDPSQIYFTSGASEANNWIVRSTRSGLVSPFEHSSLIEPAKANGWRVWENCGAELERNPETSDITSLMAVNNETGTCWDIRDYPVSGAIHVDATQIVGKLPFAVQGLSYASMSAHKLYGPKGVGALYCEGLPPTPLIQGGEQEHGFRSGTSNVPGIVGFGAAAELAAAEMKENEDQARQLRDLLLYELRDVPDWKILGGPKTSPFILSITVTGVEGETLVIEADRRGYALSSGAACSSHSTEPSHVLQALDVQGPDLRGAIRISFGKSNSNESTAGLALTLAQSIEMVRTMTGT